ncbi:MAG: MetQ/NlpA family ABC transporter substrate-binding protein [Oscillospiraceae bacterium]|nr:MetQ/NlpA family ABC transporter substrate-binding protein [Oscillospiraceae bacterium]
MKHLKFTLVLTLVAAIALSACGGNSAPAGGGEAEIRVLTIGATSTPHAEVLAFIAPVLAESGVELNIVEFDDFIQPNMALDAGDIDANYFQHTPFLNTFNDNHGTDLVPVFGVHFEPLKVYAGRLDTLENIPEGATIAIPDDPSNEARALQLLEYLGLISLAPDLDTSATANDVADNPYGLVIRPIAADLLPRTLPDVDFAVINGNFALLGGVLDRAIDDAGEGVDSPAAQQFTNIIAVRNGDQNDERIAALIQALSTQAVRDFIYEQYLGRVVPVF